MTWLPVKVRGGWRRHSNTKGRSHPTKSAAIYLAIYLAKRGAARVGACRWLTLHRFNATMMVPRKKAIKTGVLTHHVGVSRDVTA